MAAQAPITTAPSPLYRRKSTRGKSNEPDSWPNPPPSRHKASIQAPHRRSPCQKSSKPALPFFLLQRLLMHPPEVLLIRTVRKRIRERDAFIKHQLQQT